MHIHVCGQSFRRSILVAKAFAPNSDVWISSDVHFSHIYSPIRDATTADEGDAFLEIQAGAGGRESGDWVEMLLDMYTRWAAGKGFEVRTYTWQESSLSFRRCTCVCGECVCLVDVCVGGGRRRKGLRWAGDCVVSG